MKLLFGSLPVFLWILHCAFCKENSNKWKRINTTDTTYGTPMSVEGQLSASQCLAKCSAKTGCVSANVHRENLQCELSTDHPLNRSLSKNHRPGWSVYYTSIYTEEQISQWVQSVTAFSSEYAPVSYSAYQIVGAPDVYPQYGTSIYAWSPVAVEPAKFIQVRFAEAVYITGVEVYEVRDAGVVTALNALDVLGSWTTLWSTSNVLVIRDARIFSPKLSVAMNSRSREVRIETRPSYYVQIDAVKLLEIK